jgi:integrase
MVPALCGLRIGEVLGLLWQSIDLKANLLHVRTALIDAGREGRKLAAVKSSSSRRTLPLPQELAHELKLWKLKCPPSEQGLVFATLEGKPLHRKAAIAILDYAITAAGIRRLTLHRLRHGFASLLLSKGVPITTVSKLMGHRDPTITLRVYSHFIKDKTDHVQELASSILS